MPATSSTRLSMCKSDSTKARLLSKENTLWLQGMSALTIMLLHYVMQIDGYPSIANIPAGSCVSIFLLISGFGINESFKQNGLKGFWEKRLKRVAIPFWIVILVQLPFWSEISTEHVLRNLCFTGSDLWFIDFIVRWYIIYWIGRKFLGKYCYYLLIGYALYCTTMPQLMSEQALSFLCGVVISDNYTTLQSWTHKRLKALSCACLLFGIVLLAIKTLPSIQEMKGTIPFNMLLLNIRLALAFAVLPIPFLFPIVKNRIVAFLGRISYEIYIVHYNFMPCIANRVANIFIYSGCSIVISMIFHEFNDWMKQKEHFLQATTIIVLGGIAYLFATKYGMRASAQYGVFTISYLCLFVSVVLLLMKHDFRLLSSRKTFWICLLLFTVLQLIVQYHFDPLQIKVDRWSAIAYPLQNVFHGEFPYLAKTHLGGYASPFPIWQLLHVPFYLLGNVGLSEIVTSVFFIWTVKYLHGVKKAFFAMILLALCINVWYEVSVRSDLISNFLLLASFVNILRKQQIMFQDHPILLSAIAGLWLSTRLSTAFPLFILFLPGWATLTWKKKIISPAIALGVFALTFLPLALWDAETLFHHEYNPFILQSRQGNQGDSLLLLLLATIMAWWTVKKEKDYYLCAGLILVLVPIVAYGHRMIQADQSLNIFDSWCDITYLDAAVPFLIMALCNYAKEEETKETIKAC